MQAGDGLRTILQNKQIEKKKVIAAREVRGVVPKLKPSISESSKDLDRQQGEDGQQGSNQTKYYFKYIQYKKKYHELKKIQGLIYYIELYLFI